MSHRVLQVAAPLVSLFFFSAFVVAGVNVTANCTLPSYSWTFNSLRQSPCVVAATMLATCYSGSYTLVPLPSGDAYGGPTRDHSNKCECSTVGYSLISACVACQGQATFYWSEYVVNCTSTLPPSQFPNPVPAGTRVPHWAILDVTNENNWNAAGSRAAGDTPEYGPGAIFGPSGVSTSTAGTSPTSPSGPPTSTSSGILTSPPKGSSSSTSAIVGGVVGVIAVISIAAVAIFYVRRAPLAAFQPYVDENPRPLLGRGAAIPSSPSIRTRFSDLPYEQPTFQGYTGPHSVDNPRPGSISSHIGRGNNMQTSLPPARGYHGLPIPSV